MATTTLRAASIQLQPTQDSADNDQIYDVVGNKTDTSSGDSLVSINKHVQANVTKLERHVHNWERWLGLAASPVGETHRFDTDSMSPFRIDAGNDTWGAWVQIVGSTDFPITAGMTYRDAHRILITDIERDAKITRIQIAGGEDADAAVTAGNYTEFMCTPLKNGKQDPIMIMTGRAPSATKGWARCWVKSENTGWVDFFIGIHEYEQ